MTPLRRPLLPILGFLVLISATAWGIRVWQGTGERSQPDRRTHLTRTLHEGNHTIAPGQSLTVPFEWTGDLARMPSVPPDLEPYEEPEKILEMTVSVSEGDKADVWLVRESIPRSAAGKRPASRPPDAINPFSRSGVEGTFEVAYHHDLSSCFFILANPSDIRPVSVYLRLRRGAWRIEPSK